MLCFILLEVTFGNFIDRYMWMKKLQCTRTITHFRILKELVPFVILKFCPEHNINTTRDINLQPFSNKYIFGEHPSVLLILLFLKVKCRYNY